MAITGNPDFSRSSPLPRRIFLSGWGDVEPYSNSAHWPNWITYGRQVDPSDWRLYLYSGGVGAVAWMTAESSGMVPWEPLFSSGVSFGLQDFVSAHGVPLNASGMDTSGDFYPNSGLDLSGQRTTPWHPPQALSGMVTSGAFSSGQISLWHLGSGAVTSGFFAAVSAHLASGEDFLYTTGPCHFCGRLDTHRSGVNWVHVTTHPIASGWQVCPQCAGFNNDLQRFETREDWIRESLASRFGPHMPCWALADYLEEQGRDVEARWLRTERSGR